jgi:hypothetical protein
MKFQIFLEQSEYRKETYKLERIKDLAYQDLVYKSIDSFPTSEVCIALLKTGSTNEIGTLEIKFEFFNDEVTINNYKIFKKYLFFFRSNTRKI